MVPDLLRHVKLPALLLLQLATAMTSTMLMSVTFILILTSSTVYRVELECLTTNASSIVGLEEDQPRVVSSLDPRSE